MSSLSTHVLDLANGRPAAGITLRLLARYADVLTLLSETRTDENGRATLLGRGDLEAIRYRLEFEVGAYFRSTGPALAEPAFLDIVTVDFGVSDASIHHHVPLLVSPFGYSTYRGS